MDLIRAHLATITRREWRRVWVVIGLLLIITSVPYLITLASTPAGYIYTGIHVLAPGDFPVYYTYIQAAADGAVIFRDIFTSEPHAPFNLNLVWVPIGWLAGAFSLTPLVAFHLARLAVIPLFVLVLYPLLGLVWSDARRRGIALVLISFGAGVGGWWEPFIGVVFKGQAPLSWHPMDLWVSEAYPFLSAFQTAHFTFGTTLILLILAGTLLAWRTNRYFFSAMAGVAGFVLMSFHPFHLPTLVAILLAWLIVARWRWRIPWRQLALHTGFVTLLMLPTTVAQIVITLTNPIAQARADQNILLTPNLLTVIISYGWVLAGAVWILAKKRSWQDSRWVLLGTWAVVHFALLYAPIFFQRRLTQGLFIPLAILATEAIVRLVDYLRSRWQPVVRFAETTPVIWLFLFLMLFGFSPLLVVGQDISLPRLPQARTAALPFYLPNDYQQVIEQLRASPSDTVFLSSAATGNILVGLTQRIGYLSHDVETIHFAEKIDEARRILQRGTPASEQAAYFRNKNIHFLVWGDREPVVWPDFDPTEVSYLTPVFVGETAALYRVRPVDIF